MTVQPCPDCGTIMVRDDPPAKDLPFYDWICPGCGMQWTDEQIQSAYLLMGFSDRENDDTE